MANTTLTQTGAQVQADLDKVEGMANIKSVGSGLSLSSAGQLSASVHKHFIVATFEIYSGASLGSTALTLQETKSLDLYVYSTQSRAYTGNVSDIFTGGSNDDIIGFHFADQVYFDRDSYSDYFTGSVTRDERDGNIYITGIAYDSMAYSKKAAIVAIRIDNVAISSLSYCIDDSPVTTL